MYYEKIPELTEYLEYEDFEELNPTRLFLEQVEILADTIPEIDQKKAAIIQAGELLLNKHDLGEGFFDSQARSLVFIALAERHSRYAGNKEKIPIEDQLIDAALEFIAHGFKDSSIRTSNDEAVISINGRESDKLYDEFTDQRYTLLLEDAIKQGLLDDVKKRLQIDSTNEEPFKVRVLKYTTQNGMLGLRPRNKLSGVSENTEENIKAIELRDELVNEAKELEDALKQSTRELSNRGGGNLININAFTRTSHGVKEIGIPLPLAIKLLYPERTKLDTFYADIDQQKDKSILEHEYVHTQGGVELFPGTINIGSSIEEKRADHFSEVASYKILDRFFSNLKLVTGWDAKQIFNKHPKGGMPEDIYTSLANTIGLNFMLELLLLTPANYAHPGSKKAEINHLLGGFDGLIARLHEQRNNNGLYPEDVNRLDGYNDGCTYVNESGLDMSYVDENDPIVKILWPEYS